MHQVVVEWIGAFGYWGVFALIAVENIFPPIPSEVILTFAGFCTATTALRAPGVVAAAGAVWCGAAFAAPAAGRPVGRAGGAGFAHGKAGCGKGRGMVCPKGRGQRVLLPVRAHCAQPDLDSGGHGWHASCAVFSVYGGGQHGVEYPSGGPWRGCGAKLAACGCGHCISLCRAEMGAGPYGRCPAGGGVCAAPCS